MATEKEAQPLLESFANHQDFQSAINLLGNSNSDVHRPAADIAFTILTTEFEPAALIPALKLESWKLRSILVEAIKEQASNFREDPAFVVQASTQLRGIIAAENPPSKHDTRFYHTARNGALQALWQIAEQDALPDIFKALGDPKDSLRDQASEIVIEITDSQVESGLIRMINKDSDFLRRAEAIIVLGKRGNLAAIPYLVPLLGSRIGRSSYSEIGYRARKTLAQLGPDAIPDLLHLISAPETVFPNQPRRVHTTARKDALWTVERIFEDSAQVEEETPHLDVTIKLLTSTLADDVRAVSREATSTLAHVIWKTSSSREEAISKTVAAIRNVRYSVYAHHLLRRLERLKFASIYTLPALKELSSDKTLALDLRSQVLSTIKSIEDKQ